MYEWLKSVFHTDAPGTVLLTGLTFLALLWFLWYLTSRVGGAQGDQAQTSANRLVALIGALCGWMIGIAFAPFTEAEQKAFQAIGTVVSAFLSGYVVSKLDRYLEAVLFPVTASKDAWARMGLFAASLLLVSVVVFLNRLYAFRT